MNGSQQYLELQGNGESGDSRKRRLAMFAAGGSALAFGLSRDGWTRRLMTAAGGFLLYRSVASEQMVQTYFVVTRTINKPIAEVYSFFRDRKNWPLLDRSAREEASAEELTTSSEDLLELSDEVENRSLRWQLRGSEDEGEIGAQFSPAPGNRGTEVWIFSECTTGTSPVRRAFKLGRGSSAEHSAREYLRCCKQLLECGEIATTQGQPVGRRGLIAKAKRLMMHEDLAEMKRRPAPATPGASPQEFAAS